MTNPLRMLILLFISAQLSACAMVQNALPTDAAIEPGFSYVYGDFRLAGNSGPTTIALALDHPTDFTTYLGLFDDATPSTYAVKIPPGQYSFGQVVYIDGAQLYKRQPLNKNVKEITLTFKANKAYYLGDYSGEVSRVYTYRERTIHWQLTDFRNRYKGTTAALKKRYPQFANIETVNIVAQFETQIIASMHDDAVRLEQFMDEKNYLQAYTLAKKMAEKNDVFALNLLGYLHEHGLHVEQSYLQAANFYKQAADRHYTPAMLYLGRSIIKSQISKNNTAEKEKVKTTYGGITRGLKWIDRAGVRANTDAMLFLCNMGTLETTPIKIRQVGAAWCNIANDYLPQSKPAQHQEVMENHKRILSTFTAEDITGTRALEEQIRSEIIINTEKTN